MNDKLILVENFDGMKFLSSPQISEDEQFMKFDNEKIVQGFAITIFMSLIFLAMVAIAYFTAGSEAATILFVSVLMVAFFASVCFIYGNTLVGKPAYIDKDQRHLVLASGTEISKQQISCFRQYTCVTKLSNFRLVLTTVVTHDSNELHEYAVTPVSGKMRDDRVGAALSQYFGRELIQDNDRRFTSSELLELGLS